MLYAEKLKDPRWQRKRLEVFRRADFACEYCGVKDKPLSAHHTNYRKGLAPWDYTLSELLCLCDACHGKWHSEKACLDACYAQLSPENQHDILMKGNYIDDYHERT